MEKPPMFRRFARKTFGISQIEQIKGVLAHAGLPEWGNAERMEKHGETQISQIDADFWRAGARGNWVIRNMVDMGRCPTPRQGEVLPAPPARLRRANKHDGMTWTTQQEVQEIQEMQERPVNGRRTRTPGD